MSKSGGKDDLTEKLLKLQALREKVKEQEDAAAREEKLRQEKESELVKLQQETGNIAKNLEVEREKLKKFKDAADELNKQKTEMELKLSSIQSKLNQESSDKAELLAERKKAEEEMLNLKKNLLNIEKEILKVSK